MARLPSTQTYNDLNGAEAIEILTDWFIQLLKSQPLLQPHLTLPHAKIGLSIDVRIEMYAGGTVPVTSPPDVQTVNGTVVVENHLSTTVNAAPLPGGQPPDAVRRAHNLPISRPGYGPRDTGSHIFLSDVVAETERSARSIRDRIAAASIEQDQNRDAAARNADPDFAVRGTVQSAGGRVGIVADGYVLAEAAVDHPLEQSIPVDNGEIKVELGGKGIEHAGMKVLDDTHRASVKTFGDGRGERRSSVNGVYDAGPRGLMNNPNGGGLGSDGRPRISFGNDRRG